MNIFLWVIEIKEIIIYTTKNQLGVKTSMLLILNDKDLII